MRYLRLLAGACIVVAASACSGRSETPPPMRTPIPDQVLAPSVDATPGAFTASGRTPDINQALEAARSAADQIAQDADAASQAPDVTAAAAYAQTAAIRASNVRDAIIAARRSTQLPASADTVLGNAQVRAIALANDTAALEGVPADGNFHQKWAETAQLARDISTDLASARSSM